ncbi:MAG: undecaprenyl-diphosphatase [Chloroflexota bacterium]|jgi:undecaprenyl-diphosphatase|nr:undecaprenyl-diphosphatase [Chloroflexota bacterium]
MVIDYTQAILLGLLQGITELFPISSLGHSVILPQLLGWDIHQEDPSFLTFLVATHTATALVLLGVFWRDWVRIARGFARSIQRRRIGHLDPDARLAWLLIAGTIPAGLIGLAFESKLRGLFASPQLTAGALFLNGLLLFGAELLRRRPRLEIAQQSDSDERLAKLGWPQAFAVGIMQAIALIPGFSRTGAALAGGLLVGLSHEDAARYSFLLATPIIGAASLLKLPTLLAPEAAPLRGPFLVGALCAGVAAFLAVQFLTRYFETNRLTPFAIYCMVVGIVSSLLLFMH